MARKSIPIEDKITKQKEVVSHVKDRYDAAIAELEKLMRKRNELRNKELIEAYTSSGRSFEEVMRFLASKDGEEE